MPIEKSKCPVCGKYADNLELEEFMMCADCASSDGQDMEDDED